MFQIGILNNRNSFPFSNKSSHYLGQSLRITRASNNPDSFCSANQQLITCICRQGVSNEKMSSLEINELNFLNKHQNFNVCQSKRELIDLTS